MCTLTGNGGMTMTISDVLSNAPDASTDGVAQGCAKRKSGTAGCPSRDNGFYGSDVSPGCGETTPGTLGNSYVTPSPPPDPGSAGYPLPGNACGVPAGGRSGGVYST